MGEFKFKKGDRVIIIPGTEYEQQSSGTIGEVIDLYGYDDGYDDDDYKYRVKWENNTINSYRNKDLKLAEDKSEFKKGDYVVVVEKDNTALSQVIKMLNYCFKLKSSDYSRSNPLVNCEIKNVFRSSNSDGGFNIKERIVRYATPEEIKEYDRIGKPYDITTLKKPLVFGKFNIGDIVVRVDITNNTSSTNIGDIFKILKGSDSNRLKCNSGLSTNVKYKTDWRLATPEEIEFYKACGKNIKNMPKEFVLPEKWCVKCDGNGPIGKYFNNSYNGSCYSDFIDGYLHRYNNQNEDITEGIYSKRATFRGIEKRAEYTEITLEQFKQYVLKDTVKKSEFKVGDWVSYTHNSGNRVYTDKIKEWGSASYCKLERGKEPFKSLLRKATQAEIDSVTKKEVPKYVECIYANGAAKDNFDVGKIYKCSGIDEGDNVIVNGFKIYKGLEIIESTNLLEYTGFKPSTKEAYDKQQQPKGYIVEYNLIEKNPCSEVAKSQHQQCVAMDFSYKEFGEAIEKELLKPYSKSKDNGFQKPIICKKVNKINKLKIVNI